MKTEIQGLLVEDNAFQLRIFSDILESSGYRMTLFTCAEDVLLLKTLETFHFLLFDIVLTGITGNELANSLIERFGDRCPPIILMSASAVTDEEKGSFPVLQKPFSSEQFVEMAQSLLIPIPKIRQGNVALTDLLDVEKMGSIGRNADKQSRYFDLLAVDVKQCRQKISLALDQGDSILLSRTIHNLKGLAAHLTDKRLTELAAEIEEELLNDSGRSESLLKKCFELLDPLIKIMDSYREGGEIADS